MSLSKELPELVISERTFFHVAYNELNCFKNGVKKKDSNHQSDFKTVTESVLEALDSNYYFDWQDPSENAQQELARFRTRFLRAKATIIQNLKNPKKEKFEGMGGKVFISSTLYKYLLKPKVKMTTQRKCKLSPHSIGNT